MNHTFKIDKINNVFCSYEYCYRNNNRVVGLNILDKRGNFKTSTMMNVNSNMPCVVKIQTGDYMIFTEYKDGDDNDNIKFIIKQVDNINKFKYDLKIIFTDVMSLGIYNNIKNESNLKKINKIFKDNILSHNIINALSLIGRKVFYENYDTILNN